MGFNSGFKGLIHRFVYSASHSIKSHMLQCYFTPFKIIVTHNEKCASLKVRAGTLLTHIINLIFMSQRVQMLVKSDRFTARISDFLYMVT